MNIKIFNETYGKEKSLDELGYKLFGGGNWEKTINTNHIKSELEELRKLDIFDVLIDNRISYSERDK